MESLLRGSHGPEGAVASHMHRWILKYNLNELFALF
jgi:hypothetical protein